MIAVNVVPPADLLVEPDRLPFADGAIEAVTSLDALEHVPPAARAGSSPSSSGSPGGASSSAAHSARRNTSRPSARLKTGTGR